MKQLMIGVDAFKLGTGRGYSVLAVVKAFEEASGVSILYKIVERRPGDVAVCYEIRRRLIKFGWKADKRLYGMCRDAW